ncbi:hypothetical protein CONCODRAFT_14116 [Conidiobolus coronatus NRRL 28638]|uniref:Uncharacterized protein n=1 Tax=Conidiobolus coronatus (strain ATCC 28846 / CBS 209.66 / NRRL 28638) TaxID=796925 RepID=A0A137NPM1_CONC2|nr:hypothetical protein CONCODRAFT_14116 [Conidiobolus coronatus NRRL 28638]|eukprot:KXN64687.1 hypothetical protein CONCODRAFT_14116 [Conidiobolus coronatus NRRL 28638]
MYKHILTYQINHSIQLHNGNPILTEEYLSICNSEINSQLPEEEKKKLLVKILLEKLKNEEFESLFSPLEDRNIVCYKRLKKCRQKESKTKIESKLKKTIGPPQNLRPRTVEKKDLATEEKEKFKKDGIYFYCRDKGHIVEIALKTREKP